MRSEMVVHSVGVLMSDNVVTIEEMLKLRGNAGCSSGAKASETTGDVVRSPTEQVLQRPTTAPYRDKVRAMKRRRGELTAGQPEVMKAFAALSEAASSPGALDEKTKELIALAIAVIAKCDECIAIHVEEALKSGATRQEIIEALGVAVLMGGGPAVMYATHALTAVSEFTLVAM